MADKKRPIKRRETVKEEIKETVLKVNELGMLEDDIDISSNTNLTIMIAGASGIGKTTLVSGVIEPEDKSLITDEYRHIYDKLNPVLYIDTEINGSKEILRKNRYDRNKYTIKSVRTIESLTQICSWLYHNPGVYKTVIIDSIQELQRQGISKFVHNSELNIEMITGSKKTEIQHYGYSQNQMISVLLLFKQLGINFITTCISHYNDDDNCFKLAVPNKQAGILPSIPDLVGNIVLDKKERKLITNHSSKFPFLKDRTGLTSKDVTLSGTNPMLRVYAALEKY